jgi:hypothetical protein
LWIPCEWYRGGTKKTIDRLTQISVLDSTHHALAQGT